VTCSLAVSSLWSHSFVHAAWHRWQCIAIFICSLCQKTAEVYHTHEHFCLSSFSAQSSYSLCLSPFRKASLLLLGEIFHRRKLGHKQRQVLIESLSSPGLPVPCAGTPAPVYMFTCAKQIMNIPADLVLLFSSSLGDAAPIAYGILL